MTCVEIVFSSCNAIMDFPAADCVVFFATDTYAKGHLVHHFGEDTVSCRLIQSLPPLFQGGPAYNPSQVVSIRGLIRGDVVCDEEQCDFDDSLEKVNVYHDMSRVYDMRKCRKPYIVTKHISLNSQTMMAVDDSHVRAMQKVVAQYVQL